MQLCIVRLECQRPGPWKNADLLVHPRSLDGEHLDVSCVKSLLHTFLYEINNKCCVLIQVRCSSWTLPSLLPPSSPGVIPPLTSSMQSPSLRMHFSAIAYVPLEGAQSSGQISQRESEIWSEWHSCSSPNYSQWTFPKKLSSAALIWLKYIQGIQHMQSNCTFHFPS